MSLSKPVYEFLGFYFDQLFNHPLRTKSVTSCIIATSANAASQYIAGNKTLNPDSLIAFGLFGLLFAGPVPHFFYSWLERVVPRGSSLQLVKMFLIERLLYTPCYQVLSLYALARLERKSHEVATKQLYSLYWPVLQANWRYLSLLIFINLMFVPPTLRVFTVNIIGFFWAIFLANKRRQQQEKSKKQ